MEEILRTFSLTKRYGRQTAVKDVSLSIGQGEIYGLIGRNGAGKTTLLRLICNLAQPTAGDFSLFGERPPRQSLSRVGALIEAPGVFPALSAQENLMLKYTALGGRDKRWPQKLLDTVGLSDAGSKKVGKFSMGMKQRLGIALALVGRPDLVVLDEPINGLDPQGIAEIRDIIEELNRTYGVSFLISSHILEELSKIATSYGFLHQGHLLQQVTREELATKCRERIELTAQPTERACTVLEEMGISDYRVTQDGVIQIFERLGDSGDIAMTLMQQQVRVLSLCEKNENLEDYYLKLTGGQEHV